MSASLAALQRGFLEALMDDAPLPAAVAPSDAIAFYRDNVRANQRAAMAAAYPVIERLVGIAFFTAAAHGYARRFPSSSGDLHAFGARFGDFLDGYEPARGMPYAADVARLEWAVHECACAADAPPLDVAALAAVSEHDQPALRVRLAPSVRRVRSPHAVAAIWQANQPGCDGTPDRDMGPDDVLVFRRGVEVEVHTLDASSGAFLDALARGEPLELASAALGARLEALPALLARWTRDGVIAAFE